MNSVNCQRLLDLIKACDRQLAKVAAGKQGAAASVPDVVRGLAAVAAVVVEAARLMEVYCGRGFLLRMALSSGDGAKFGDLETRLRNAMQVRVDRVRGGGCAAVGFKGGQRVRRAGGGRAACVFCGGRAYGGGSLG